MIEIPLNSSPEQLFSINLSGVSYNIRVIYNSRLSVWSISFLQGITPVIEGVPIVGGIDILKQYNIPISNIYMVNLDNPKLDPNINNLGTTAKLFILTDAEVGNV